VFDVVAGTLTLTDVDLINGRTGDRDTDQVGCDSGGGGAICVREAVGENGPELVMRGGSIRDSRAAHGGGIFVGKGATATLTHVVIDNCVANSFGASERAGFGGGIDIAGGRAIVSAAHVTKNKAPNGGGIAIGAGTLRLSRSVVSGNGSDATNGGGERCRRCDHRQYDHQRQPGVDGRGDPLLRRRQRESVAQLRHRRQQRGSTERRHRHAR
jgi:hypothetical protein